jgi:hypothetical protein
VFSGLSSRVVVAYRKRAQVGGTDHEAVESRRYSYRGQVDSICVLSCCLLLLSNSRCEEDTDSLLKEYIELFPDDWLSKVLKGFLKSNLSPFPKPRTLNHANQTKKMPIVVEIFALYS